MNKLKKIHYFSDKKIELKSIPVEHGKIDSICYIINSKCAYASDVSKIYDNDIKYFFNLKYFVVDCLRYNSHYSHYNLAEVLDLVKIIKQKKFTLISMFLFLYVIFKYFLHIYLKINLLYIYFLYRTFK